MAAQFSASQEVFSSVKLVSLFNKNKRVSDGLHLSFRCTKEIRADLFVRKPVGIGSSVEVKDGMLKLSRVIRKQNRSEAICSPV
jgi:hypothetical protein